MLVISAQGSSTRTRRPSAIKRSTRWLPTNPAPPVTMSQPIEYALIFFGRMQPQQHPGTLLPPFGPFVTAKVLRRSQRLFNCSDLTTAPHGRLDLVFGYRDPARMSIKPHCVRGPDVATKARSECSVRLGSA